MLVVAILLLGLLAAAAIALQLAIPWVAANRVRTRLTESGGAAEVSVRALPATRLLRNAGDSLEVRGRGLVIGLSGRGAESGRAGLAALDGFGRVDVELVDFRTGPFAIAAFVLTGSGGGSYALAMRGTTTAADLLRAGEGVLRALPGGPLIGAMAAGLPLSSREVAFSVEIGLVSEPEGLRVGSGGGTIAGYPAGPIATAITAAVAGRLEITP